MLYKSRYANLSQPLLRGFRANFQNGEFSTDDPEIIDMLDQLVEMEAESGNRSVYKYQGSTDSAAVSGTIYLQLDGYPQATLVVHGETLENITARIQAHIDITKSQSPNHYNKLMANSITKNSIPSYEDSFGLNNPEFIPSTPPRSTAKKSAPKTKTSSTK